jgi:pilus assembly protein Flp/PilA
MLFARKSRGAEASLRGQGLVEYALILVLVAIVVIAALMILGPIIGNTFSTINNSLTGV